MRGKGKGRRWQAAGGSLAGCRPLVETWISLNSDSPIPPQFRPHRMGPHRMDRAGGPLGRQWLDAFPAAGSFRGKQSQVQTVPTWQTVTHRRAISNIASLRRVISGLDVSPGPGPTPSRPCLPSVSGAPLLCPGPNKLDRQATNPAGASCPLAARRAGHGLSQTIGPSARRLKSLGPPSAW